MSPLSRGAKRIVAERRADTTTFFNVHTLQWLREALASDDLAIELVAGRAGVLPIAVVYLRPMVDSQRLSKEVFTPLLRAEPSVRSRDALPDGADAEAPLDRRRRVPRAQLVSDPEAIIQDLLYGNVALFAAERRGAYVSRVRADVGRPVDEATTEVQLLGPKEAFTESLDVNLNLLRSRLPTTRLRVKTFVIGRLSRTRVGVVHVDGITNQDMLDDMCRKLAAIDVDYVRDSIGVYELTIGRVFTPVPLVQRTERPDRVVEALCSGRLAVIVEGSPFALVAPTTLNELHRDGDAFAGGVTTTIFIRWLRYVGVTLALIMPAIYAVLFSIDLHVLSPALLQVVAATRENVPYPVLFEALLMLIILDVVIEVTLQAPAPIGQALTIVGSLIIGQAAVQAQLASQLMVIVLAITTIGSLLAPNLPLAYAVRIFKYPVMVAGGLLGVYGLTLALVAVLVHLSSLKSLGISFMAPAGPVRWRDLRLYSVLTAPKGLRRRRPETFHPEDMTRVEPTKGQPS